MTILPQADTSEAGGSLPDTSPEAIAVALVEDNRLMLDGIAALLGRIPDIDVVGGTTSAAAENLDQMKAAVVLVDLGLENGDSLKLVRRITRELPESRVVLMDLLPDQQDIVEYVEAGVFGFVMKDATLDALVKTIRSVAAGMRVLPSEMTGTLFSQIAHDAVTTRGPAAVEDVRMTSREREVIDLIAEGCSNKKIAASLHISPYTVKSHVRNIMDKLALHTRLQIAAWAHGEET